MAQSDLLVSLILICLIATTGVSYLIRILMKGRVRYERIDRQGGSLFLAKPLMEMGYWALQPLSKGAIRIGISANMISFLALFFGAITGVLMAKGHFGWAGMLGLMGGVLDALDGMVARATSRISLAGKVLDSSLDRYVEFFLFGGLLVYYSSYLAVQVLVFFALLGSFMVSYSTALSEITQIQLPRGSMQRPERMVYLILGSLIAPIGFTFLAYPVLFSLLLIALIGNLSAVARIRFIRHSIQEKEKKAIELTLAQVRSIPPSRFNQTG